MKTMTLFYFFRGSELVYEKEAPGKDIDLNIKDQTAGGSQVSFVWIDISDCAIENSNYMNLVDSLELTDKTNEQLFDEFKDVNTAYEFKEKLIIKPVEYQNVLFDLEHNKLTNLIS